MGLAELSNENNNNFDIFPGNSAHPKVVFREVLYPINWNLEMLMFNKGENQKTQRKPLEA